MSMRWYEELDTKLQTEINILAGCLNLPELCKYESLSHFLHDVRSKFIEAKYLIKQASDILGA